MNYLKILVIIAKIQYLANHHGPPTPFTTPFDQAVAI